MMTSEPKHNRAEVELPAPTIWPLVLALGVTLSFAGLLSTVFVSVAGAALIAVAAVGWWRQVLPHAHHEAVPIGTAAAPVVAVAAIPVEYLRAGKEKHRVHLPAEIKPWSAAFKGSVVGAFAMAGVAVVFGVISQGSIWYPINLLAAAAVPSLATASVEQLRQFSTLGLILGIIIHALACLLVGMLYAVMLPMFPRKAFWWAGLSAPVLWSGVIGSVLNLVNPALSARIDWRWFVASQLAFGLTGGFVIARAQSIETRQDWPLAARAGIEVQGGIQPRGEGDPTHPPVG